MSWAAGSILIVNGSGCQGGIGALRCFLPAVSTSSGLIRPAILTKHAATLQNIVPNRKNGTMDFRYVSFLSSSLGARSWCYCASRRFYLETTKSDNGQDQNACKRWLRPYWHLLMLPVCDAVGVPENSGGIPAARERAGCAKDRR